MFPLLTMFGQNIERKYLIDIYGGFQSHQDKVSIGGIDNESTITSGKIALAISYKVNNFLYVGLGFEYLNWNAKQANSYYNDDDENNNTFILYNNPIIKNSIILPSINGKLFRFVTDKWFIGLNIKNGYGFINAKSEYIAEMKVKYLSNNPAFISNIPAFKTGYNEDIDKTYYTFSLEPELIYFISDRVSLKMQVVGYRFDNINKSQFFCSSKSNEILWSLGLNFALK